MQEFLPILSASALFAGIKPKEILTMLPCLEACLAHYDKGAYILRQGDEIPRLPLLLRGRVYASPNTSPGDSACTMLRFPQ